MAVRGLGMDALAAWGAAVEARQVGLGCGFIDEDQPRRVKLRLPLPPLDPRPGYVGTVLLTGPDRLFL